MTVGGTIPHPAASLTRYAATSRAPQRPGREVPQRPLPALGLIDRVRFLITVRDLGQEDVIRGERQQAEDLDVSPLEELELGQAAG